MQTCESWTDQPMMADASLQMRLWGRDTLSRPRPSIFPGLIAYIGVADLGS